MKLEYVLFFFLMIHRMQAMARHPHQKHKHSDICAKCPPGFGVSHKCTVYKDTLCVPCPPGYYSAHSSSRKPCYPCSRCGTGLYVAHHCVANKDTVCDSCHTYKGPHNDDFLLKCVLPISNLTSKNGHFVLTNSRDHIVSKDMSIRKSRTLEPIAIAVAVTASFLATVALVAYFVVSRLKRKQLQKVTGNYVYKPVATQEAIML